MKLGWIYGAALVGVLWFAALASAGTVTVNYDPPADNDLAECRFFLQNAQGGALDNETVLAADLGFGATVVLSFDTAALQGQEGRVVARCVDLTGNESVESTPLGATFPAAATVIPRPPVLRSLQVAP